MTVRWKVPKGKDRGHFGCLYLLEKHKELPGTTSSQLVCRLHNSPSDYIQIHKQLPQS